MTEGIMTEGIMTEGIMTEVESTRVEVLCVSRKSSLMHVSGIWLTAARLDQRCYVKASILV